MVITISDHKGGVGKTATAGALAQGLGRRNRKKVKTLLIDADAQGSASKIVYGTEEGAPGLYDVMKGNIKAVDAIITTEAGDILPYQKELSLLDIETALRPGRDYDLKKSINELRDLYDYIIIDTAPGLSITLLQALTASDAVLIPITASPDGVESLTETYRTIKDIKDPEGGTNTELKILGTVITLYNGRSNVTKQYEEYIEEVTKSLDIKLLKTRIRRSIVVEEARALQVNLFDYAPKNNVVMDYEALIKELKL